MEVPIDTSYVNLIPEKILCVTFYCFAGVSQNHFLPLKANVLLSLQYYSQRIVAKTLATFNGRINIAYPASPKTVRKVRLLYSSIWSIESIRGFLIEVESLMSFSAKLLRRASNTLSFWFEVYYLKKRKTSSEELNYGQVDRPLPDVSSGFV